MNQEPKTSEPDFAPHWVIDGKDGPALLLYDENSSDLNRLIRVYGSDQQQIAERICAALNTTP